MKAGCLIQGKHFDHDKCWALLVLTASHQAPTIPQTHFKFGNAVGAREQTELERPSNLQTHVERGTQQQSVTSAAPNI
jgi:hypothetical protein